MIRTRLQRDVPFFPNMLNNRKVEVCLKEDVDKVIEEKDAEIHRLQQALWLARAERALAERRRYCAMAAFENIEDDALRIKWCEIQNKCLKKAEEYK